MTSRQLELHLPAPPATGDPLVPARMVNESACCASRLSHAAPSRAGGDRQHRGRRAGSQARRRLKQVSARTRYFRHEHRQDDFGVRAQGRRCVMVPANQATGVCESAYEIQCMVSRRPVSSGEATQERMEPIEVVQPHDIRKLPKGAWATSEIGEMAAGGRFPDLSKST